MGRCPYTDGHLPIRAFLQEVNMGQNGMQMLAMVVPIAALGGLSYYLVQRRRKRSDRAVQDQRNRRA
jgi:hypothetical protein